MPEFADEEQSVSTRPAWTLQARRERDAILQPPNPEITPAAAFMLYQNGYTTEPANLGQKLTNASDWAQEAARLPGVAVRD